MSRLPPPPRVCIPFQTGRCRRGLQCNALHAKLCVRFGKMGWCDNTNCNNAVHVPTPSHRKPLPHPAQKRRPRSRSPSNRPRQRLRPRPPPELPPPIRLPPRRLQQIPGQLSVDLRFLRSTSPVSTSRPPSPSSPSSPLDSPPPSPTDPPDEWPAYKPYLGTPSARTKSFPPYQ
jgi:hypothetical protein